MVVVVIVLMRKERLSTPRECQLGLRVFINNATSTSHRIHFSLLHFSSSLLHHLHPPPSSFIRVFTQWCWKWQSLLVYISSCYGWTSAPCPPSSPIFSNLWRAGKVNLSIHLFMVFLVMFISSLLSYHGQHPLDVSSGLTRSLLQFTRLFCRSSWWTMRWLLHLDSGYELWYHWHGIIITSRPRKRGCTDRFVVLACFPSSSCLTVWRDHYHNLFV